MIAAPHDQGHAARHPQARDRAGVGPRQGHAQRLGAREGNGVPVERPVVHAAAPGQDGAVGHEGDQSLRGELGAQGVGVLHGLGVAIQQRAVRRGPAQSLGHQRRHLAAQHRLGGGSVDAAPARRQPGDEPRFQPAGPDRGRVQHHGTARQHRLARRVHREGAAAAGAARTGQRRGAGCKGPRERVAKRHPPALAMPQRLRKPGGRRRYQRAQARGRAEGVTLHVVDGQCEVVKGVASRKVLVGLVALAVEAAQCGPKLAGRGGGRRRVHGGGAILLGRLRCACRGSPFVAAGKERTQRGRVNPWPGTASGQRPRHGALTRLSRPL